MTVAIRVHAADDVAVVLEQVEPGADVQLLDGGTVTAVDTVPRGHKIALRDLPSDASVHKYGAVIGRASRAVRAGEHVHSHNLATRLAGLGEYTFASAAARPFAPSATATEPFFEGYVRSDGRVGTRNEIWIVATVGCVARLAQRLAEAGRGRYAGRIDGVHALTHPFGCSQSGRDLEDTRRVLAALASHPNAGGVLVVGLGCETNQARALMASMTRPDEARVRLLAAQAEGDEFARGLALLDELVALAERDVREPCGPEHLCLGLKCGGSDGLSGITANPLVGRMADRVVGLGGRAVLTEIPEAFGAEQLLLDRAVSCEVFDAAAGVFRDFRAYLTGHGEPLHENPSPGNIAGGITTLEEKSLGAVQKGGRAPLTSVLRYGERVERAGLALLEAPGNDAVSSTALAAAGANVILFTTGRGTPLGFPVPTLKIASNSELARRKPSWIDFDAGAVLASGGAATAEAELLELVRRTASGAPARNELNGEREIALWKRGVTL
ncbi:MAG TPA: altronate dehydratase family protein [Steroidobacteraceae bacterium]|nr:altronate dehydratase family protein [Steroidobacteraceae bacterium]